ncbi:MAG TPA: hypothetical protein VJ371_09945 [Streptosporangiaceae bacterium]|jgi:hypothetical protein|nr:hypothetical protein [Streptosporangiaceae bacterium]
MTVTVDRSVEDFVATPRQLFIDGQWTDAASGQTFETGSSRKGRKGVALRQEQAAQRHPVSLPAGQTRLLVARRKEQGHAVRGRL